MEQIKQMLAQLKMYCRLEMAMVDKLEELSKDCYALKEDVKRLTANVRVLERKNSELLYALNSYKKDLT